MVKVHSLDGKEKGDVKLSQAFAAAYRPDLIQRAVVALASNARQSYGTDPAAGLRTSGDYFGSRRRSYRQTINRGMTRLPRVKSGGGGLGRVVRVPQSKGGRRAHPPKNKDYSVKINRKEHRLALNSAIAATCDVELVKARGHLVGDIQLPFVVEDKIEELKKTKDLLNTLNVLGFEKELGSKKMKKALLVVGEDRGILSAASNIPGVDVVTVEGLDVDLLAPGSQPGRLTIWSESAVKKLT